MLTDAGSCSGVSSSMNGTKKFPHSPMKVKIVDHGQPRPHQRQHDPQQCLHGDAPSVQAASSSSIGTPSMKFFISQIANGSAVVARKSIGRRHGVDQIELHEQPVDRHHDRGDRQTGREQDRQQERPAAAASGSATAGRRPAPRRPPSAASRRRTAAGC